ncbi:MAG: GTP cyclohydrolase I FolE2 [Candidatus Aenigmatarchaeota archaeon]
MECSLPDVQNSFDYRNIPINRVGVGNVPFTLKVRTKKGTSISVFSIIDVFSSLPKDIRGTNMSRYLEVLYTWPYPLTGDNIKDFLKKLKERVNSEDVYLKATFNYPIKVSAPKSKLSGDVFFEASFIGLLSEKEYKFYVGVKGDVTSYCPCSKELSLIGKEVGKGAHAQRGQVAVLTLTDPPQPGIWIEDIAEIIRNSGSSKVYPILKRVDEKYVTEEGYSNAKFVEDIARDVTLALQKIKKLKWFSVKVVNFESIHQHNAICYIFREKVNNNWIPSHSL